MSALINSGYIYEQLGQLDSASFYTNQAYDIAVKLNGGDNLGICLNNLGSIYSKMNQPDIAMGNYRLSLSYFVEANNEEGLCEATLGIAKLFKQKGQDDSCLNYAKRSFSIAQNSSFTQRVLNAGNFLADYYKQHKVVDSAYKYLSELITARDSLFSQEKTKQIQSLSFDEIVRQQEIAAAKAAEEKEHRANIQYAFIALGLVSFIILFLLLSNSVIVTEKWIRFLGVLGLLLVFEFINLYFHPYISDITHHIPVLMFSVLVVIASLLIPLHHRIEHWVTHKMVAKNKRLQIAAAKRTLARLEGDINNEQ